MLNPKEKLIGRHYDNSCNEFTYINFTYMTKLITLKMGDITFNNITYH